MTFSQSLFHGGIKGTLPETFPNPFDYQPHPLAQQAAQKLQHYLQQHPEAFPTTLPGHRIAVLVVHNQQQLGYLATLEKQPALPGFIPPNSDEPCMENRLLDYALKHHYRPVALAAFWWGSMPEGEIRHHRHFYPPCRSQCYQTLGERLKPWNPAPQDIEQLAAQKQSIKLLYDDEFLSVIDKPHELLSVPGKNINNSVYLQYQQRFPDASGPLLLHRLDMATSGILLLAKNSKTHKLLQKQFMARSIKKRYIAVLEGVLPQEEGEISLPLRTDFNDRPRQMLCRQHGKPATTKWQKINTDGQTTRVYFYPISGRTHQLRVHAAHPQGLNCPIVGDRLYGRQFHKRLLLHAEQLSFYHPFLQQKLTIQSPCPF